MTRILRFVFLAAVVFTVTGSAATRAQKPQLDPAAKPKFIALLTAAKPTVATRAPSLKAFTEPKPRATPVKPRDRPL